MNGVLYYIVLCLNKVENSSILWKVFYHKQLERVSVHEQLGILSEKLG